MSDSRAILAVTKSPRLNNICAQEQQSTHEHLFVLSEAPNRHVIITRQCVTKLGKRGLHRFIAIKYCRVRSISASNPQQAGIEHIWACCEP